MTITQYYSTHLANGDLLIHAKTNVNNYLPNAKNLQSAHTIMCSNISPCSPQHSSISFFFTSPFYQGLCFYFSYIYYVLFHIQYRKGCTFLCIYLYKLVALEQATLMYRHLTHNVLSFLNTYLCATMQEPNPHTGSRFCYYCCYSYY